MSPTTVTGAWMWTTLLSRMTSSFVFSQIFLPRRFLDLMPNTKKLASLLVKRSKRG